METPGLFCMAEIFFINNPGFQGNSDKGKKKGVIPHDLIKVFFVNVLFAAFVFCKH